MKIFKDLEFKDRPMGMASVSKSARMNFGNKYGVSVIFGSMFYSNGIDTYEIGIMYEGSLTYDTHITDDVIGYQTEKEVTQIMKQVQKLKP